MSTFGTTEKVIKYWYRNKLRKITQYGKWKWQVRISKLTANHAENGWKDSICVQNVEG